MIIVVDTADPFGDKKVFAKFGKLISISNKSNIGDLVFLDRGNADCLSDIKRFPFPSYSLRRFNADDSVLLQEACNYLQADIFMTALPTPLRTPSVLMFSETFADMKGRPAKEFEAAMSYCEAISVWEAYDVETLRRYDSRYASKAITDLETYLRCRLSLPLLKTPEFYDKWSKLRVLQAEVDAVIWET